tara:strand:- start:238 stop:1689 length:1452 start_codon:yes stop_codon:yes gene_type:complete
LALLIASSAAAQASFTRITWKTEGQSLSRSGAQLVVEATGAARLERVFAEGALRQGTPESVLRGQLSPAELQALEAALRAPGLSQLPRQLRGAFSGPRLELSIERPGGRATLRAEGFAGRFGDHQGLLLPIWQVLEGVWDRLHATRTELLLQIDQIPLPATIRADEDLDLVVSGPGLPGVEFASLRVVLSGRTLVVEALGRQVPLAPAQRFSQRLRVERPGRVGLGYLHVKHSTKGYSDSRVMIVQSQTARAGLFTGRVVRKKGQVSLEIQVDRQERQRLPLEPAAAERLGRFVGEYVHFEGVFDASDRLAIRRLIRPERRQIEGLMLHYGSIRGEGLGHVSTLGPAQKTLQGIEPGTRVAVEGWFFSEGGWPGPRKWYDTGGRSLYRAQRLYAERVRATVTQPAKLKRGWKTRADLQPGEEVWIGQRRHFGWSAEVESLDGSKSGRARFRKRFEFAQPIKLASERRGSGVGIAGSLGSASKP